MKRHARDGRHPTRGLGLSGAVTLPSSIWNTVTIESPYGLRSFTLHVGDVVKSMDAALVVPSHSNTAARLTGAVLSAVASKYGVSFDKLDAVVAPKPNFGTFRVLDKGHSHYAEILLVRIPGIHSAAKSGAGQMDVIHEVLWTLFGSLAALELRTDALKSVALPLLAGTRGYEIRDLMAAIIEHSVAWLKASKFMKAINLYIPAEHAVEVWSQAMDDVLGRKLVDTAQNKLASALREEILARLGASVQNKWPAPWQPDLQNIEHDLQQSKVSLERLAGNCRKLSERMVFAIASEDQVQLGSKNLADAIAELRKQKLVAPWILAHLDCLRVLGNAAVHSGEQVTFVPPRLMPDDLLALLAALQRLLAFAESRYSQA